MLTNLKRVSVFLILTSLVITHQQEILEQQQINQQVIIDNNCTVNKFRIPVSVKHIRTIYQFSCFSSDEVEPKLPSISSSQPYEYNEMDLSHNVFGVLPYDQLCSYKYIYSLNVSSNYITNLTGAFVRLKCLGSLTTLDLSLNLIVTPILATDFDDSFASRLQSLNLESNKISYIQTGAFIKKDSTSRFPNLNYLNLARNLIKKFDLLWPLSLPSPNLLVDLKLNPIEELINQMGFNFKHPAFVHDMVGNRYVDMTTNNLQYLDDSNLMQYGLQDAKDFRQFMNKISNYDLRQSNYIRTFICFCPTGGQYTVTWFKNVSSSLDLSCPIYQIFCSNYQQPMFVLNFPCEPAPETTTKMTIQTTETNLITLFNLINSTTTKTSTIQATNSKSENFLIRVLGSQYTPSIIGTYSSTRVNSLQQQSNDFAYLFLLIIPLLLILIISFVCLCGRRFQVFIHNVYSVIMCPCFRPDDNSLENNKIYDLTICYNEYDDLWLNEQFMPQLSEYDRGYKIHKLSLYHKLNFHLSETTKRILESSKRIVLIFSEKFYNDEWNNRIFHEFIKTIHQNDNLCIVVAINLGNISETKMKSVLNDLNLFKEDEPFRSKLKNSFKHTLGLTQAEYLEWTNDDFWKHFNYIMPYHKNSQITKISNTSYKEKRNMPKYINQKFEISKNSLRSGSSSPVSRLKSMRNSKKRSRKVSEARTFEFNTPRISIENTDTDTSMKKSASVRQIIVPIPNEMRTQLGSVVKSKPKIFDLISNNNDSVKTINETDTDKQKNKIFLTYNSKQIEPVVQTERLFLKSENSPSENVMKSTTPTSLFDRQPSSKRTRLHSEVTSTETNQTATKSSESMTKYNTNNSTQSNGFNSRQLSFVRKSRRRSLSKTDTNSLNGDSSR